ncbi:hypothetical protein EDD22DRAFT_850302 [Suillus occidentalis]|nr:hypothetical protein EDD22DRAFT_850302 [Suillus occidentalis]
MDYTTPIIENTIFTEGIFDLEMVEGGTTMRGSRSDSAAPIQGTIFTSSSWREKGPPKRLRASSEAMYSWMTLSCSSALGRLVGAYVAVVCGVRSENSCKVGVRVVWSARDVQGTGMDLSTFVNLSGAVKKVASPGLVPVRDIDGGFYGELGNIDEMAFRGRQVGYAGGAWLVKDIRVDAISVAEGGSGGPFMVDVEDKGRTEGGGGHDNGDGRQAYESQTLCVRLRWEGKSHRADIREPDAMRLTQVGVGGKEPSSRHTRAKRYAFDSGGSGRERAIEQTYESQTLCV